MSSQRFAGVELAVAAVSDTGLKRKKNEDAFLAQGPAFVVADGMGGYDLGDEASAAVVAAFASRFEGLDAGEFSLVHESLLDADDRVARIAARTARGAGSTATGAVMVIHDRMPFWLIFNVGDSRVYRHFGSELTQLTEDHSLGNELVKRGELDVADLATFRERNVITRAIGASDSLADSWLVPVITGERLLLCSDGLHGEIDHEQIRAILTMNARPAEAASVLLERALAAGGRDNITVIVLDVVAGGADALSGESTWAAPTASVADDTLTS